MEGTNKKNDEKGIQKITKKNEKPSSSLISDEYTYINELHVFDIIHLVTMRRIAKPPTRVAKYLGKITANIAWFKHKVAFRAFKIYEPVDEDFLNKNMQHSFRHINTEQLNKYLNKK